VVVPQTPAQLNHLLYLPAPNEARLDLVKIPLWQLISMISLAHRSGANDDWIIDFASNESGKGFLLTAPVLLDADALVPAA